jgi:hypothetical protein
MSKVDNVLSSLTLKAKAKEVQPVVNQAQADQYDASSIEDVKQLLSKSVKSNAVASSLAAKAGEAKVSSNDEADFFQEAVLSQGSDTEVVIRISVNGGKINIAA